MDDQLGIMLLNIKASLGAKQAKLSKYTDWDEIQKIQKKAIKSYISDPKTVKVENTYSFKDFDNLKEKASKGINVESLKDTADSSILSQYENLEDLFIETQLYNDGLKAMIPHNVAQTLFGVDEREPSDFEKSKFIRGYKIAENPNYILELLQAGLAGPLEVETLVSLFPNYSNKLKESIIDVVTDMKGEASKELTTKQNNALANLLQVTRLTPDILKYPNMIDKAEINVPGSQETDLSRVSGN